MFSWAGKSIFLASGVGLGEGIFFPSVSEKHSPSCDVSLHQRLRSSVHPVGVAPAFSKKGGRRGGDNAQTQTSEQVTGSPATLRWGGGLVLIERGTLSLVQYPALVPSCFLPPEEPIDPLSADSCVSSVRIIPRGIGFPLLPCSREPRSCPFLILPALTSQWHWARQECLCIQFGTGNRSLGAIPWRSFLLFICTCNIAK